MCCQTHVLIGWLEIWGVNVMQTLDSVSGLHNCREFSQLRFAFRRGYVNMENVLYCLNNTTKYNFLIGCFISREELPEGSFLLSTGH